MKTAAEMIIKLRWIIIIAFIGVTIVFALQIPKAEMDADMLNYLPEDMPSRISKRKIESLFGGTEMLLIVIKTDDVLNSETLRHVKSISRKMKRIKGVDKVYSLFDLKHLKSDDGAMIVDPAVKRIPEKETDLEALRNDIRDNDIVYGNVVSKDFTVTAVFALVKPGVSDEYIVPEFQKLIDEYDGDNEIVLGGTPFSRLNSAENTKRDLSQLMPLGLLIMLIFLFVCFRQLRGVFLPFTVVIMAILFAMGMIPLVGWNITVVTIILPVMLIAVANDYGIHMIAKFQEDTGSEKTFTRTELAQRMFESLAKPIVLTGLTTIVGMLCLYGHILIPAGQMGMLAAAGIVYALAASLLFIPAVVSLLPIPQRASAKKNSKKIPLLERLLNIFGSVISQYPKNVIRISMLFGLVSMVGVFFVEVNNDPIRYYDSDHPIPQAAKLINKNLGGFFTCSLVFEGDIKEPRLLKKIDRLEKKIREIPEVENTQSIARVVRQMSRVLNDKGDPGYDRIPDTRNAVAQYFELYLMSGDPADFEKMVDFTFENALLTVRINSTSTPVLRRVVNRIKSLAKDDEDVSHIGGIAEVFSTISYAIAGGQLISLGMAILAILIILMILFRSFTAGIFAAFPLLLSTVLLFGLMGLLKIELNAFTALLSSIMIGVGIDYTIHFLWRFKEERAAGKNPDDAAMRTLTTTGRGIIFNALSVIIGFSILLLSSFIPVRFFGFLVVVSIFSCLISALVLIPALCVVVRPRFLEPKEPVVKLKSLQSNDIMED